MPAHASVYTNRLVAHFQPILGLDTARIVGYEALTRGPRDTPLHCPRALFAEAARTHSLLELEEECWRTALASMQRQRDRWAPAARIFLNALPTTLLARGFERTVSRLIEHSGIDTKQVVIEISETTLIEDFTSFRAAISSYRMNGFSIAIDDVGAGHSGLLTVAEIAPDLLKIDAGLVRGVDQHIGRRATIDSLLMLARTLGIDVIAEGIERPEELSALRAIGVQMGQGYLLGRPAADLLEDYAQGECPTWFQPVHSRSSRVLEADSIGRLSVSVPTLQAGVALSAAVALFEQQNLDGIVVMKDDAPVGVAMRNHVYALLGGPFGRELYLRRPLELSARTPLIVDDRTPLQEVSRLAMARNSDSLFDHIVLVRDGILLGVVSVQRLLAAITDARVNAARNANPLTGLPGNAMIEREIRNRIRESERVALLYLDLDDFKAFNDRYGFHRGDIAITMTADLIAAELDAVSGHHFLGHIGGDDFLIILPAALAEPFAERVGATFEARIASLYAPEDAKLEFIRAIDRSGREESFPLMTLSIAREYVEPNDDRHYAELIDELTAAKRVAKAAKRGRRRLAAS